ncbi:MAG: hypothetical protein SGILL_001546 [Bacillariaceae sp.]
MLRFKCRLVATTGTSGAKCPQFHIDHVPVRWIQSFVGPGVELVVGNKGVRWGAFSHMDDDDGDEDEDEDVFWTPQQRNEQLVDGKAANIYSAQPGEAVLMLGSEWNQISAQASSATSSAVDPVVHKSPELPESQSRVLLTQDIVID